MADFNVVKDYDWTSMPKDSSMRYSAPFVFLKSFKLISNQIAMALQGFVALADNLGESGPSAAAKFYTDLYRDATEQEDTFFFPYFDNTVRSFNNNFGDTFQSGIGGDGGLGSTVNDTAKAIAGEFAMAYNSTDQNALGGAKDALVGKGKGSVGDRLKGAVKALATGGSPGTYIESPKFYEYNTTSDSALQVSFVLANTINAGSLDQNHKLIKKLIEINRPMRMNSIAIDPPRIYEVKVPGHRFIKWAYCSDFSVSFVGTRRMINGILTPEAYQINMSFTSLTMEHAGFMADTMIGVSGPPAPTA